MSQCAKNFALQSALNFSFQMPDLLPIPTPYSDDTGLVDSLQIVSSFKLHNSALFLSLEMSFASFFNWRKTDFETVLNVSGLHTKMQVPM